MGCLSSKKQDEDFDSPFKSRSIDSISSLSSKQDLNMVKLLLLGGGESGKSTVLKQFKLLYGLEYTQTERLQFASYIKKNIMDNMLLLCLALYGQDSGHALVSSEAFLTVCPNASELLEAGGTPTCATALTSSNYEHILTLWKHAAIQSMWSKRSELHVLDNTATFLSSRNTLENIAHESYSPDNNAILNARIQTSGIRKETFCVDSHLINLVDLGGQRGERRKWVRTYEESHGVLFITALSEFDMLMWENKKDNRVQDSIDIFDSLMQEESLNNTQMILFFNKSDLLREKLNNGKDLRDVSLFSDYRGKKSDFDDTIAYFTKKFEEIYYKHRKRGKDYLIIHVTSAIDPVSMKRVLDNIAPKVVERQLSAMGFL